MTDFHEHLYELHVVPLCFELPTVNDVDMSNMGASVTEIT
jgi:hypothetical protein